MALLPGVFIPEEAESTDFETLPAGWYTAEITKSELKDTKDKTGKYLALQFKILEDEVINGEDVKSENRIVFTNLNLVNKNETAVRIARSDLKKICKAINWADDEELEDSVDLHNQEMRIKLSIKPATSEWPERNEIKDYKGCDAE